MELSGSSVLITGASGGLGQAIARSVAKKGAKVILSARRVEILEQLAHELGGEVLQADLEDPKAPLKMAEAAGDVDVVVANAGLPASDPFEFYSEEDIERIMRVNLLAPTQMARVFLPKMVEKGKGHFVFVSSLSGKAATPGSSLYSATKFGLRGLSHGIRADIASSGVGVSVVCPGFIRDAGMFADAKIELPKGVGTKTPQDVGKAVVRVIEHNIAEIDVAPITLSIGSMIASIAPEFARKINKLIGADEMARNLSEGQAKARSK